MKSEFDQTVFEVNQSLPKAFVIITAYNPKGLKAPQSRNLHQDATLRAVLTNRGLNPIRVIGQSPDQTHQEPGWAVELDLASGLEIGRIFKQLAIFQVEDDVLNLHACDHNEVKHLGSWRERLI